MDKTFVSRAGNKLNVAIEHFGVDVKGLVCADLGCSTGGFTDCLLQNGVSKVYAVDTAYGELAWKLRNNPQVIVMERQNALFVELPEKVDFISIDVGWTRQELIIKKALDLLTDQGQIISLLKPHYEADKKLLVKGKLKDDYVDEVVSKTLEKVSTIIQSIPALNGRAQIIGCMKSPVIGDKAGNAEFLYYLKKLTHSR